MESAASALGLLPLDDPQRSHLHNEVHARPQARIRLPALVVYVAVFNKGVTREQEWHHLRELPGQESLEFAQLAGNFLRLRMDGYTVKWERHTEFTRYSIVQPLPNHALLGAQKPELTSEIATPVHWLRNISGSVIAAIEMAMVPGDLNEPKAAMQQAQAWMGDHPLVASVLGNNSHSWAVTDFVLRPSGFERMLVITAADTTQTRAGRMSQRLLELETYRLMALQGLPVAKQLGPVLGNAELALADITTQLENKSSSDQDLLDTLVSLAARVERATAEHVYRFSATRAYDTLVGQRITELREKAIPGTQTIGEFMQRRLSPAMATVASTEQRLASLSERVSRASALLRTRVDIAAELQNQTLLEKLSKGQELQLQLQTMVEGLSIAAISYYVISLLVYAFKALKGIGLPINPDMAAGLSIPVVAWGVWMATRRIHKSLKQP
jgi:uncharacterized membrane-anchored protein